MNFNGSSFCHQVPLLVVCAGMMLAGCSGPDSGSGSSDDAVSLVIDKRCKNPADGELLLHVPSPDWRDQFIYFLMIDRFNDGDSSNNDQGAGEYAPDKEAYWSGGDIDGIIDQLDYIQALGATAVWITPPVANQWWSDNDQFSGYHGYWATHFKKLDPHYGTMEDYKRLSHELHCRGMYLVQDIVANHTGVFFGYRGGYNPEDTAQNFTLFEADDPLQPTPEMYPFNMVDRLNPEHEQAAIYNWTPPISDYNSLDQQYTYQLASLADLNTTNPLVLSTLKDAYRYWIDEVGVDAFRVDTVKYVEHEFWHHFFHDGDGIFAGARATGRDNFLAFGEVFEGSAPFENSGEKKVAGYLGTAEKPELNSLIGFPLYFELDSVFAGGKPTSQLAYRLEQWMEMYPDPYIIPSFVDNHDTKRFLSAGSVAAIKQALGVIFTIPGIPIVYQGTEQGHTHTRQAMFADGYHGDQSDFSQQSELYRYIKGLAQLRAATPALTRGTMVQLASEASGAGVMAYKREHQGETVLVLLNTADHGILVNDLETGLPAGQRLDLLFAGDEFASPVTGPQGKLTLELPARAMIVTQAGPRVTGAPGAGVEAAGVKGAGGKKKAEFSFDQALDDKVFTDDFVISGTFSEPGVPLKLIRNGNLDRALEFSSDAQGRWQASIAVRDLGEAVHNFELYAPEHQVVSPRQSYRALVTEPTRAGTLEDGTGDATGSNGNYVPPQHDVSEHQHDIVAISFRSAGANLELTLTMRQVTDVWAPPNGFDNVAFTTFINLPDREGATVLPLLDAQMADGLDWDIAHVAYGWGNYMYASAGSEAGKQGDKVAVSPRVTVDKAQGIVRFMFEGERFGVESWDGSQLYVTTWDVTGEGSYREVRPDASSWNFGGAEHGSPRIMDDVLITVAEP